MKHTRLSENLNIKKVSEDEKKGVFVLEGLYTGYGITLGNALRRVCLSSLPGAAITQIKIKGIDHEFSVIEGMMEDVIQFTLNLKKVRFKFYAEEPQVLYLKAKGEKEVKAGDIEQNAFVKVVNPDLILATLTDKKAELDVELTVEKGLGYVPVEFRKNERLNIGTIFLDAVFSPIVNFAFKVENMRVGERTDYNRLILEIETDGTILPSEALRKACHILEDHFKKISEVFEVKDEKQEIKKTSKKR